MRLWSAASLPADRPGDKVPDAGEVAFVSAWSISLMADSSDA
jgi:hypothetical protein